MKTSTFLYLFLTIAMGIFAANSAYYGNLWPATYESQTAVQKSNWLWTQITADTTPAKEPSMMATIKNVNPTWLGGLDFSLVGSTVSDQIPQGIYKGIHAVGIVCRGKFIWNDNKANLSGSFSKGNADHVIMRLSSAVEPKMMLVPNVAFKILRDGAPSGNFFSSHQIEAQNTVNAFEYGMCNHVHQLQGAFSKQGIMNVALNKVFEKAGPGNEPNLLGVSEVANLTQDGKAVGKLNSPWAICIQPTIEIHNRFAAYKSLDGNNFPGLTAIGPNTMLYHVYAVLEPEATKDLKQDNVVYIGDFSTTDKCTSSKFGDEQLFYKHTYWTTELKITGKEKAWANYKGDWTVDEGIEKYEPLFLKQHRYKYAARRQRRMRMNMKK